MGTQDQPKFLAERAGAPTQDVAARLTGHESLEHEGTIYRAGAGRESPVDLRGSDTSRPRGPGDFGDRP